MVQVAHYIIDPQQSPHHKHSTRPLHIHVTQLQSSGTQSKANTRRILAVAHIVKSQRVGSSSIEAQPCRDAASACPAPHPL